MGNGPELWNQFAAVKDGSGDFVTFDAPLQLNYTCRTGAAYGEYSGKKIVLQYGGFGDLWGIPGYCVSRSTNEVGGLHAIQGARYVPSFAIPFDETTGRVTSTDGHDVVSREVAGSRDPLRAEAAGTCTTAGLNVPSNVTLPTTADLRDPSDAASPRLHRHQADGDDAPRVIHGDVKY